MPAKKIIDEVGSTWPVIGSSIATVTAGPRPGSTPIAVPSTQPTKAHSRLIGVAAVAKPPSSWFQIDMSMVDSWGADSEPAGAGQSRQVDRQQPGEHPVHRRGDHDAGGQVQ